MIALSHGRAEQAFSEGRFERRDTSCASSITSYLTTSCDSVSQKWLRSAINPPPSINQTALSYDLQGNLTDDGAKKYVWDIAGRLKEVRDSQDTLIASFKYDPFGRRTTKYILDTNNTYTYYYDGWRVLEEHDNGAFASRNVWGLYLDELVVRTNPMGTDLYPVSNPIYSPLRYYGGDGALEMRIQYTPYGRASLIKANGIPVVPDEASYPILFTGQRFDAETGLCYYKNRYHSSFLGRFFSRDSYAETQPQDAYEYVSSRVVNSVDSWGLEEECCCCCVEDVDIKNVSETSTLTTIGHEFDFIVKVEYVHPIVPVPYGKCTLKWEEKTNIPYKDYMPKDKWFDLARVPEYANTIFWEWNTQACEPGTTRLFRFHDNPYITVGDTPREQRTLEFMLSVWSSPNCPCARAFDFITAKQVLGGTAREPIRQFKLWP